MSTQLGDRLATLQQALCETYLTDGSEAALASIDALTPLELRQLLLMNVSWWAGTRLS